MELPLLLGSYVAALIDLSEKVIAIARQRIEEADFHAAILVGDARNPGSLQDSVFDAGLLMGPLDHLHDAMDRAGALRRLFLVPICVFTSCFLLTRLWWPCYDSSWVDFSLWQSHLWSASIIDSLTVIPDQETDLLIYP